MITPKQLLEKAGKLFNKVVSAHFKEQPIFPLVIPSNKHITGTNFTQLKKDLVPLYQASKLVKGKGYMVEWKEKKINGSVQSVPGKIYFETLGDFLYFVQKEEEFNKIENARNIIISRFQELDAWTANNPSLLLEYSDDWQDLIKVCDYFAGNPPPRDYYIRELPVEVHSKFIEQRADILKKLLDQLLPIEWINHAHNDFTSRYLLKKVNVYTQIRILDSGLRPYLGYDECSLTIDDAAWLKWIPSNVFIIENQTCFLTFPKLINSVAIFGEGFKSRLSKHIPWLGKTNLFCWFDLDAAGFEMLNMVKQNYAHAVSLFMDQSTYAAFSHFAVNNITRKKELPHLSHEEQAMYCFLVENGKRLEQERISQRYIQSILGGGE